MVSNKIILNIGGDEYPIVTKESVEFMAALEKNLNKEMDEVRANVKNVTKMKLSILTAINMCYKLTKNDELIKIVDDQLSDKDKIILNNDKVIDEMKREIMRLRTELTTIKNELARKK